MFKFKFIPTALVCLGVSAVDVGVIDPLVPTPDPDVVP